MEIKAQKYQGNYHRFNIPKSKEKKAWLFTCSDVHFDNPKCDRKLFFKHMDLAIERGAMIAITGDLFCLMQGKYDPRGSKSNVRPEHNKDNYLDLVINDTAEKFIPYAKNIILISRGNHETSVSKRMETDVMERFIERLNLLAGSNIQIGAYTGYYTLSFEYSVSRFTVDIGYSHGNWGGVITKGTLSVVRYASYMPDCDIMFSGHCFDDKTEILTTEGWVTHDRVSTLSQVATLNEKNGRMEYNYVNSVHRYDDYKELYHVKAKGIDLMTTDEHGLIFNKRKKDGLHKCKMVDFDKQTEVSIPNTCNGYKDTFVVMDYDILPLASWIIADGSIEHNHLRFHFKKERKIERVKELLTNAKIPFNESKQKGGTVKISLTVEDSQRILKHLNIEDKHFSEKYYLINDQQCEIILREYMLSDGNKAKNHDSFVLYSNNLSDLSVLQAMCAKVGLKSTMYSENEKRGTSRLNVSTRNSTFFARGRYDKVPYSGTVWCVNVNNGTLVVRRNGCVMVTQNTHDGWIVTHPRLRKNHSKRTVDIVNQWHIKTGTYKEEYGDGSGWAVERIAMPKYLGGCFTEFNITKHGVEFTSTLTPNANIRQ